MSPLTVFWQDGELSVREQFDAACRTGRPLRIAATDTRNLHLVTELVQLCGLSCDTDLADGWVTVTIVGGE